MKTRLFAIFAVFVIILILPACTNIKAPGNTDAEISEENNTEGDPEMIYDASSEIMEVESFDGYMLKGRLSLPGGAKNVSKLVIYVNGSGANTYLNRRTGFVYFDTFAGEFSKIGAAFFSYNTRGVDLGENLPMYNEINEEEYKTYLPSTSVEDIYHMICAIKENERMENCEVYLLGWSEGTIIAPLVAKKYPDKVDGLLLAGYANQNMKDILIWQNTGGSSYTWFCGNFEADTLGRISRDTYFTDQNGVIASTLQNAPFEEFDVDGDGYIDENDCKTRVTAILKDYLNEILAAIERRDDEWLKKNYGGGITLLTSGWFLEHFNLRSNMEVLPELDLPIYIFHGSLDMNIDFREVYKINDKFKEAGKTNLTVNVFEKHNHDLNYIEIIQNKTIPAGIQAIFDAVKNM